MATVHTSNLYRLTTARVFRFDAGAILWLIGSRPSPLGGHLGHFCETYRHGDDGKDGDPGTYSPTGRHIKNLPMDCVEPF